MKSVGWGIIGTGSIASKFVTALEGLQKNESTTKDMPEIVLAAVSSRSEDKAREFSCKWGFDRYYDSYDDLLKDENVSVVYIATPHSTHSEISQKALESGKHVLCEKPCAMNAIELKKTIALSKEKKLFFMEALWTKCNPVFQKTIEWIREGKIGSLLQVKADFCFKNDFDAHNRLFNLELGGGALLDVGIYPLTLAMSVAGSITTNNGFPCKLPTALHCVGRIGETGVDHYNSVNAYFGPSPSKLFAQLSSAIDFGGEEGFEDAYICGTAGKICIKHFWAAQTAELYIRDGLLDTKIETYNHPFLINGYEYEIMEVMNCISNGYLQSGFHTHDDSLSVCNVLDECKRQMNLVYPCQKEKNNCDKNDGGEEESSEIIVYTDGACSGNPGRGGWGTVILSNNDEIPLSGGEKMTTNNRMELTAAIKGLSYILDQSSWYSRPVKVFIDSQYVKNGITQWIKGWKRNGWKTASKQPVKNKDLWIELDDLVQKLSVKWVWVKGHAGNKYNEMCDALAVEAGKNS